MRYSLNQAPLVLTIIHLEFSEIPALSPMSEKLSNKLHQSMIKMGFPDKIISQQETVEVVFEPNKEPKRQVSIGYRTSFRASGEKEIIQISNNELIIKTTSYKNFEDFYNKFKLIFKTCINIIDDFNNVLLKKISLRYINAIVPSKGSSLNEFVSNEILPISLSMLDEISQRQGITLTRASTAENQVLHVYFEELSSNDGKVYKILPDNIMEKDPKCSLFIQGHKNWLSLTSKTYGILDINHEYLFLGSPTFDLDLLKSKLKELYKDSSKVFWHTISENAKKTWQIEEKKRFKK